MDKETSFDFAYVILCGWYLFGLFMDGWAHNNLAELETFFTPWHAAFYSGYFAIAILLAWRTFRNKGDGSWKDAIPKGYDASVLGVIIFSVGGIGDMLWHTFFGVEKSVEALISPTHLILAAGMILMLSGPFASAWKRKHSPKGLLHFLPVVLSLTFVFSGLTFMTQYNNPYTHPWASLAEKTGDIFSGQSLGLSGILLQTAIMMGIVLIAVKRWNLPLGSFFIMLTVNSLLMGYLKENFMFVPAAMLAGIAADFMSWKLLPNSSVSAFRIFAFEMPAFLYLFYFIMLMMNTGIWWSVHMWAGSVVLAGFTSLLMSFLIALHSNEAM